MQREPATLVAQQMADAMSDAWREVYDDDKSATAADVLHAALMAASDAIYAVTFGRPDGPDARREIYEKYAIDLPLATEYAVATAGDGDDDD